ncbi:MAG: arylsulfatase [Pirellulales bacterium]|nr:arylsulfatase [Pirellulales bacterium]
MKSRLTLILSLLLCALRVPAHGADRPNIVLILADDLGNADLGYRGSTIKTPNLDQLARTGVRLESYYGQQLCTPARAALMTGRYPMRHGLQTAVIFPGHQYGLPEDEVTLPQALKPAGYSTWMVGKWHLGHADKKYWPQNRGFDHFYGNLVGEVDYFTKERGGLIDWQRNGEFFREEGYHTTLLGDEAVKLIEQRDKSKPFFLYFAALAVHAPLQAPQEEINAYQDGFEDEEKRAYAAMLTHLDKQVGRVVEALEKQGVRDNTLIFFTTDNGGIRKMKANAPGGKPAKNPPASNGKLRDGKSSLYEGGVRLPAIVNWPAKLRPAVVNEPLHHVDIMPTLLALAGAKGSDTHPFDGKDIWATLAEGKPSPHEDILINVEVYRGAVRKGNWKLVKTALLPGKTELFDLATDIGEKRNVAEDHPEIVKDLTARLVAYAKEQQMSEWLKAQPGFFGPQAKTAFDADYDIDDGGLPHEKPALPQR